MFTNGVFDILHIGHIRYLEKAKSLGHILVVAINTDSSVKRLKGNHRPLIPQNERAELVAALDCVDYVTLFSEDTPLETIVALHPDILVKGGDYRLTEIVGTEEVKSWGVEGKRAPHIVMLALLFFFNLSSAPAFPVDSTTALPQQLALTQQQALPAAPIQDQRGRNLTGLFVGLPGQFSGIPLPTPHVTGREIRRCENRVVPPLARLLLRTQTVSSEL